MKPRDDGFAVITATTNLDRGLAAIENWADRADYRWPIYLVLNGPAAEAPVDQLSLAECFIFVIRLPSYRGSVPAFAVAFTEGTPTASVIACLHDDVTIDEDGWDGRVIDHFHHHPDCGLAGFGGGTRLGRDDIYRTPYDPMQLARGDFRSHMREAEAHGTRSQQTQQVAVLDGFSQIGRFDFWYGIHNWGGKRSLLRDGNSDLFTRMAQAGLVHHAYDAAIGCYARRLKWDAWLIPVACHHAGGQTAVGDADYHAWAAGQAEGGDQGFWQQAHRWVYDEFRDVLPFRVESQAAKERGNES